MHIYGNASALSLALPNMMGSFGFGTTPIGSVIPWGAGSRPLNLSRDDVKDAFASWLAWQGNPHLRVGNVIERDGNTILIDIVTADTRGLVERFAVNRHSGATEPSEE